MLVNKENKVEQVPVTTGGAVKTNWIVTSGLKAGDTVVVEGFQKIRPGAPVQASPWKAGGGQRRARRLLRSPKPSRPRRARQAACQARARRRARPACCAQPAGRGAPAKQEPAKQDPAAGQKSKRLAAPTGAAFPQ